MCSSGKLSFLETEDDQFNVRQRCVFDELDKIEMSRPQSSYTEVDYNEEQHRRKRAKVDIKKKTEEYVGCESMFKLPETPLSDRKKWMAKMPDHQINPHKWTKYSLSDVNERDLSDRGNTAAAMAFLRERGSLSDPIREDRIKIAPKFVQVVKKTEEPVIFKKSKRPMDHPLFQFTKREMPEYVVGQKVSKRKDKAKPAEVSNCQIKLDHLLDECDD